MWTYYLTDKDGNFLSSPLFPVSKWNTYEEAERAAQKALEKSKAAKCNRYREEVSYIVIQA